MTTLNLHELTDEKVKKKFLHAVTDYHILYFLGWFLIFLVFCGVCARAQVVAARNFVILF